MSGRFVTVPLQLLLCNVKERGQHVYTSAASTLQLYVQSDAAMLQRNTTVLLEYKGKTAPHQVLLANLLG